MTGSLEPVFSLRTEGCRGQPEGEEGPKGNKCSRQREWCAQEPESEGWHHPAGQRGCRGIQSGWSTECLEEVAGGGDRQGLVLNELGQYLKRGAIDGS